MCERLVGNRFSGADVGFAGSRIEEHEAHMLDRRRALQVLENGAHGDLSGFLNRVAISAGRDRGEGNRRNLLLIGDAKRLAIATGEGCWFTALAVMVDGADGVDDEFGREASAGSHDGFARGETADLRNDALTFSEDRRGAGAMDGTVDAASAQE